MPGLESFCVHCAIGLGAIFLLQCSWFVAWLSLDEKRIESGRDGLVPCLVHKDYQPPACSNRQNSQLCITNYAKLLSSRIYKIIVITFTFGVLGVGIWGSYLMRMKFDPVLLMPAESYLRKWITVHDRDFPNTGWPADIYTGPFDYTQMASMEQLVNGLHELKEKGQYIHGTLHKNPYSVFLFLK